MAVPATPSTSLSDGLTDAQRRRLRAAARQWLVSFDQRFTYMITLASNSPTITENGLRAKVKEWHKRMHGSAAGRKWAERPEHWNKWVAFREGRKTLPHYHFLFSLSEELPDERHDRIRWGGVDADGRFIGGKSSSALICLSCKAQHHWTRILNTGTTNVQRVYSINGAVDYVTKELTDPANLASFVLSQEFDNS